MNFTDASTFGGAGALYVPQGSDPVPGILAGPPAGFTLAIGINLDVNESGVPIANYEVPGNGGAELDTRPTVEFMVSSMLNDATDGWMLVSEAGDIGMGDFGGLILARIDDAALLQNPDMIILVSYVADGAPYGAGANSLISAAVNGILDVDESAQVATMPAGQAFALGGINPLATQPLVDAGLIPDGDMGGARTTGINSFWITEGIPTGAQARAFFNASMEAGRVIPQAWAPPRTAADPNPATPASPTGHHWDALDADVSIGGTWTDKISGVVLEMVGSLNEAREVAVEPDYYYLPGGGE